ncbi:unnamed protein product, partial [Schistosoma margrebowiei]|uniref:Uncharacterized protein n=1 Tax=Schistosoma margrebowiei TaxID=48269 RepID=A0AA84ZYL5_9TREM
MRPNETWHQSMKSAPKCPSMAASGVGSPFPSKYSHTATLIQPLPGKSYSLSSRGGGVVYENEMKSECP